jgi:sugar phosphate isomerase/epimerase
MIQIACSTGIRSIEPLDIACQVIAEMGFHYVDPLVMEQWHVKPSALITNATQESERVHRIFNRHGLSCTAVNLGFLYNFTTCTYQEHQINLQVIEGACQLAQTLNTSIITISPGTMSTEDRQVILDRVSTRLNEALAIAKVFGMTLALETHAGAIVVYPESARELLARCPNLKLTYDPSHYIAEHIPVTETMDLIPYVAHIHLRNARIGHFQERMHKGALDMGWMIDQIVTSDYVGTISIEYIQDCGGIQEGYEVREEAEILKQLLLDKGLTL